MKRIKKLTASLLAISAFLTSSVFSVNSFADGGNDGEGMVIAVEPTTATEIAVDKVYPKAKKCMS